MIARWSKAELLQNALCDREFRKYIVEFTELCKPDYFLVANWEGNHEVLGVLLTHRFTSEGRSQFRLSPFDEYDASCRYYEWKKLEIQNGKIIHTGSYGRSISFPGHGIIGTKCCWDFGKTLLKRKEPYSYYSYRMIWLSIKRLHKVVKGMFMQQLHFPMYKSRLQYGLKYLNLGLKCDIPILEAIWLSECPHREDVRKVYSLTMGTKAFGWSGDRPLDKMQPIRTPRGAFVVYRDREFSIQIISWDRFYRVYFANYPFRMALQVDAQTGKPIWITMDRDSWYLLLKNAVDTSE
jgi:hypothetical protein